jgi:diguanylate cyclase
MLKQPPLRLVLTLPYVVLVVALAALVGWLSYHSADNEIEGMAARLAAATSERVRESTLAYLANWQHSLSAAATQGGGAADLATVERAVWGAGAASKVRPSYVYFGGADGRFVGVQHNASGPALLKLRAQGAAQGGAQKRELYDLAAPGDRSAPRGPEGAVYDATQRPWYQRAAQAQGPVWSPVYLDFSSKQPMTTLAQAQRDASGTLVGVFAADVPLAQLQSFLQRQDIAKQGLVYIVSRDGSIIASSASNGATQATQDKLQPAAQSADAALAGSYRAIAAQLGSADAEHSSARTYDTADGRMLVSASALRGQPGVDWWVVVALREEVLTAGIARNAWRTFALAALACVAVVLLGTLILSGLVRDVGRLTDAAQRLSADATPEPIEVTRNDELGRLAGAFNRMVTRLAGSMQTVQDQNRLLQQTVQELGAQVSARTSVETRLRRMADSLAEGLIMVDRLGMISFVNTTAERHMRRPGADVLGRHVHEAFPAFEGSPFDSAMRRATSSGKPTVVEAPTLEDASRWVEVRVFPSADGIAAFFSDVTERRTTREALATRAQELTRLSAALISTQADERRAIARELHDELGQQLAALRINVQVLKAKANDPVEKGRLDDSLAIVKHLIETVRQRALDLHPVILDDLGLAAALQWLCERQAQRSGLPVTLHADPHLPALPPAVALAAFRIAQEAISNALKHAAAQRIDVSVSHSPRGLHLSVIDNGEGFDAQKAIDDSRGRSLGLTSMRERVQQLGGSLQIHGEKKRGTTVLVNIPTAVDTHVENQRLAG